MTPLLAKRYGRAVDFPGVALARRQAPRGLQRPREGGEVMERLIVQGRDGSRRLLRICGRRREGRFLVLELASQRRRCYQAGCARLADVPAILCPEHKRRRAT